ncbi:MAG: FixH family protein [Hyphomicrobiaceae bacterium]
MLAPSPPQSPRPYPRRQMVGWHVLMCMVAFFAVVISVNGAMIYSAISTYSGVVSTEPYRKGLHYNDRVQADENQQRIGWKDYLTIERDGQVQLAITNADGVPVRGLDVRLVIGRPTTNRHDVHVALVSTPAGQYAARTEILSPGHWIASVEVRPSEADPEPVYRARRRIWIAP